MNDENRITYFAETDSRSSRVSFGVKAEDRLKHLYVIGKTGMGKSNMLENMAIQDIRNGDGLAFMDPHGKTADLLLDYIPEERIKDVIYFAPFDTDFPISFNVMEDVGEARRHLVISGLMSAFEKIWEDAWSARMAYILQNTLAALLEYPGATLLGINRVLSDKAYRNKVVDNITDPTVRAFWVDEFAKYTERFAAEATPAIQNKVGQFTNNPLVRNIIGQPKSTFDLRKIMDEKKILIINLSKGLVGENNANLIGSMLITKIYLAAMSRSDVSEAELHRLPNFYLYVDEFQSFANKSFADILSEARKYKLALNIAHQYIEQMSEEVRAAVFGNVGTMISFRVGSYDAEVLEKEFAPVFTMEDIVNLGAYQMYLKLMIDGVASQPFSATGLPPIPKPEISFRERVMEYSRQKYSQPKAEVERVIKEWYGEGKENTVYRKEARIEPKAVIKTEIKTERPKPRPEYKQEYKKEDPSNFSGQAKKSDVLAKAIAEAVKDKSQTIDNRPTRTIEVVQSGGQQTIVKTEVKVEPVSLNVLTQDNKKKDKGPTEQNKNALREALEKAKSGELSAVREEKEDLEKNNLKAHSSQLKATNEVPEDVLRKVLKGE